MYIKILKETAASGERLQANKSYEVSDKDARILIGMGKAQEAKKPVSKKKPIKKED